MGHRRFHHSHQQTDVHAADHSQKGFALITLLAILPLALTLVASLAYSYVALRKKSLAQSHCVQQASLLQRELKSTLESLLKLNKRAKTLRRQREIADKTFDVAVKSKIPQAIAAASAARTAVYLQQVELRGEQERLLHQADIQRGTGERQLRQKILPLRGRNLIAKKSYWRSLAVEAVPSDSLTPDYVPLPAFERFQQQKYRFDVPLDPYDKIVQATECSVSITGKENAWKVQILAANARSNWSWF
jgi:hypothetical protein